MCNRSYYPRWSPYYKYSGYSKWSPYSKYRWYSDWPAYYKYRGRWYSSSSPYYKYGWYLSPYYRHRWYSKPYNKYRWYSNTWPYYNYNWYPSSSYYKYRNFDDLYYDLKYKMNMFKSELDCVPKNRSEFVNDLEIPDWRRVADEPEELVKYRRDSLTSGSTDDCDVRPVSALSTDSSISLSRAMTDSEIDYDRYRRLRNRSQSDPFNDMKAALEAFPPEYLESLRDFQESAPITTTVTNESPRYNEALHRRMERLFQEECRVFAPDDPGLLELEAALQSLDMEALQADLDRI